MAARAEDVDVDERSSVTGRRPTFVDAPEVLDLTVAPAAPRPTRPAPPRPASQVRPRAAAVVRARDGRRTSSLSIALLLGAALVVLLLRGAAGAEAEQVGADVVVQYEVVDGVLGDVTFRRPTPARPADPSRVGFDGASLAAADRPDTVDPDDRAVHEALFGEWVALIPPYWARRVEAFAIASDGVGGNAAYVQRRDPAGERWLMAVDPVDAAERPDDYAYTLVHELAHVVTLGAGKVVASGGASDLVARSASCGGAATIEGCAEPGSTTAAFIERFWTEVDLAAADELRHAPDRAAAALERYGAAPGAYVTPYAATDPGEDLAETFTTMALALPVQPGSIAAAKVDALAADPELFALAERIRAATRDR